MLPSPYSFRLAVRGRRLAANLDEIVDVFVPAVERFSGLGLDGDRRIAWQPPSERKVRSESVRGSSSDAVKSAASRIAARGEVSSLSVWSEGAPGERFHLSVTTGFVDGPAVPPRYEVSFIWTEDQLRGVAVTDALVDTASIFIDHFGALDGAGWFNAHQTDADPYADVRGIATANPGEVLGYSFIVVLTEEALQHVHVDQLPCETIRSILSSDGATAIVAALRRTPADIDESVVRQWKTALERILVRRGVARSSYIQPQPWMLLPEDWPPGAPDPIWTQAHQT